MNILEMIKLGAGLSVLFCGRPLGRGGLCFFAWFSAGGFNFLRHISTFFPTPYLSVPPPSSQRIFCSPYPLPLLSLFITTISPQFLILSTPHVPLFSLVSYTSSIPTHSCHTSRRRFTFSLHYFLFSLESLTVCRQRLSS